MVGETVGGVLAVDEDAGLNGEVEYLPVPSLPITIQRFCFFSRHIRRGNEQPTIGNSLTLVGGWKGHLTVLLYPFLISLPLLACI